MRSPPGGEIDHDDAHQPLFPGDASGARCGGLRRQPDAFEVAADRVHVHQVREHVDGNAIAMRRHQATAGDAPAAPVRIGKVHGTP